MQNLQSGMIDLIEKGIAGQNEEPAATLESGAPTRALEDEIEIRNAKSQQKKNKKMNRKHTSKFQLASHAPRQPPTRSTTTHIGVKYKNQNAKFNPLNSNGKPAEAIEEGSSQGPSEADMQASSRNLLDVPTNKEDKAEKKVEMNENDKKQIEEMSLSDSEQSDLGSISEITSINKSIRKSSHKQPSGVKLRK